jgi:hypothetical protein
MSQVEDQVTTLVRLLDKNVRVVKDDGSLARIYVSREWYDRELFKNYDGQVTVGFDPTRGCEDQKLDISGKTRRRLGFLSVNIWSIDKPEQGVMGRKTREKMREEILRIVREKRTKPNETSYDFVGVGQPAGTHKAYHAGSATGLSPSSSGWIELTDAEYVKLWYSDDDRFSKSHNVNTEYAMMLFRFKLETTKYDPHEKNVKQIVVSFEGYGTAPGGNGVTVVVWNHIASTWENPATGTAGSDETITLTLTSNITDYIDMDSDGVGYIYVLAATSNPSDGATPAVLYCDYALCVVVVNGITYCDIVSYRNQDEVRTKPFVWRTEFLVKSWLFEDLYET